MFQTCLPSLGPGKLGRRELSNMSGNAKVIASSVVICLDFVYFVNPILLRLERYQRNTDMELELIYNHLPLVAPLNLACFSEKEAKSHQSFIFSHFRS